MANNLDEIKKEFELERMILFSDAVFAIAITLLIIEIKFPEIEKHASAKEVMHAFRPVAVRFLGFTLSFFFIGVLWARHLEIFKYLRAYNRGVIFRNLVFIFFIVCFPFSASGITENIKPGFVLPLYIYIVNICLVSVSQYFLCHYLFVQKPSLSLPGFEAHKTYVLKQSKYSAVILVIGVLMTVLFSFILPEEYAMLGLYTIPLMLLIVRKRLRKYKAAKDVTRE